jgi:hypothetical protein
MQLKIIYRYGQCRGRPPTKGRSREGPGNVKFQIPNSKFQDLVSGATAASWKTHEKFRRWLDFIWIHAETVHRENVFAVTTARDWIAFTCSVTPLISQNRRNQRSNSLLHLLKNSETGGLCLVEKDRIFELVERKLLLNN